MATLVVLVPGGIINLLVTPCVPGLLGYYMFKPCKYPGTPWRLFPDKIVHLIIIFGVQLRVAIPFSYGICMEIVIYSTLHCFCLINYYHLFWRKLQHAKDTSGCIQMNKELQLLVTCYNKIHGDSLSVLSTIAVSGTFIVCTYAAISLHSEVRLVQLIRFIFFAVDTFIVILLCDSGFKSTVHTVSQDVMNKFRSSERFMKEPVTRRHFRSWQSAKIRLGSTNFYDKSTPLNLINFCISQVVGLLLI